MDKTTDLTWLALAQLRRDCLEDGMTNAEIDAMFAEEQANARSRIRAENKADSEGRVNDRA